MWLPLLLPLAHALELSALVESDLVPEVAYTSHVTVGDTTTITLAVSVENTSIGTYDRVQVTLDRHAPVPDWVQVLPYASIGRVGPSSTVVGSPVQVEVPTARLGDARRWLRNEAEWTVRGVEQPVYTDLVKLVDAETDAAWLSSFRDERTFVLDGSQLLRELQEGDILVIDDVQFAPASWHLPLGTAAIVETIARDVALNEMTLTFSPTQVDEDQVVVVGRDGATGRRPGHDPWGPDLVEDVIREVGDAASHQEHVRHGLTTARRCGPALPG